MNSRHNSYDITIVGGGIPALFCALNFNKLGLKVLLVTKGFDRNSRPVPRGKSISYAISPSNIGLFTRCGLREQFFKMSEDVFEMHLFEDEACLKLSSDLGPNDYLTKIVDHTNLHNLLFTATSSLQDLHTISGKVAGFAYSPDGKQCNLKILRDSEKEISTINTNLLVVADGANSFCRHILGISWGIKNYCQRAVLANFKSSLSPSIARQWFRRDEVMAFLPTSKNSLSMIWSQRDCDAQKLLEEGNSFLMKKLSNFIGTTMLSRIEIDSKMISAPLSMITVDELVKKRVILLGDAAHTVHPLAGLGLNIGLFDILTLVNEFDKAISKNRKFDAGCKSILSSYLRARLFKTRAIQTLIDTIKVGFSTGGNSAKLFRTRGMNLLDRSDLLKRYIVRFAASIL
ncbi:FAD-dependent monooxygenase [Betaproteobacteria bacterium]|nr:FAD-dependent monooxygenase [Betaproteobacteria bacterium]